MPLGEKISVNSESNKKLSDSKSRTPAKTPGKKSTKKGLSNTKENNQALLTNFFKSTPKKELLKEETNAAASNDPIRKSPRNKSKCTTSPKATTQSTSSSTSPITDSKTDASNIQSLGSISTQVSPVTRSKTSPKTSKIINKVPTEKPLTDITCMPKTLASKDTNQESSKKLSTDDTCLSKKKSCSESQKIVQKSPPKKLCVKKIDNSENLSNTEASNRSTKASKSALSENINKPAKVAASTSVITRSKKVPSPQKDTTDRGMCCNLDKELNDQEDTNLIKSLKMSKAQLKLKDTDTELFWEQAAESIRSELEENLEDNKQLSDIRKEMEAEKKDLTKQQEQLMKLADEAGEICREFMNLNDDEVDDSGILD